MGLKFLKVLNSFYPTGKAWEIQEDFNNLNDGMSIELERAYDKALKFYKEFNIINTSVLAVEHSKDYLIEQGLYTNGELQRIIVEYLNKDLEFKEIIEDFATYIGSPISWEKAAGAIEFGSFTFPAEFGDPNVSQTMQLIIKFPDDVACEQYKKITYLVGFLKPPYLEIFFTNKPTEVLIPFEFGISEFGSAFGGIESC